MINDIFENKVCDAIIRLEREDTPAKRNYVKVWGLHELLGLGRWGTPEQQEYIFANTDRLIKFCERKERSRGALIIHIRKQLAKADKAGA